MTLSFSLILNGKPTFFVCKIWQGILNKEVDLNGELIVTSEYIEYFDSYKSKFLKEWDDLDDDIYLPKIHTIRADPKNRWQKGKTIHFIINNRTPQRFQFAPLLPAKALQRIEIEWVEESPIVVIEGGPFYNPIVGIDNGMAQLAKNDGFGSIDAFFAYFNSNFTGKIIHWTDFVYSF